MPNGCKKAIAKYGVACYFKDVMDELNDVLWEEFVSLVERLKLDTQSRSQGSEIRGLESELETFLAQDLSEICVGPYMPDWDSLILTPSHKGRERLSDREFEAIIGAYRNLFLPHRQIRFIGVDLDDCLYDVTPIRNLLAQKINNVLRVASGELRVTARDPEPTTYNPQPKTQNTALVWALYKIFKDGLVAEDVNNEKASAVIAAHGFSGNIQEIAGRARHAYKDFSRLDDPEIRALYKPYEGAVDTLRCLMESGDHVIGILTNGPSKFQRDKIDLLGLKEGEHFNFVQVSEDIGIGKPSRRFFERARERASRMWSAECGKLNKSAIRNPQSEIRNEECLVLEDQVKFFPGAEGWLKVQFLQGNHSNIQPENILEMPKYGMPRFSTLLNLLELEKDGNFQAVAARYFILKLLLLLRRQ